MEFKKKERINMTWIFIEFITTSLLHYICITKQFQIQTVSNPNSIKSKQFQKNHTVSKPHSFKTTQFQTTQFQNHTVSKPYNFKYRQST